MEQNNNTNTYNQATPTFPSQNYNSVSQKQDNMKRLFFLIGAIFVAVLIFVLVVVLLMNLKRSSDVQFKKTAMMSLYEQLDEKMTYEDLQAKINEVVPGASIIYDEDMYIIGFVDYDDGEDDEDAEVSEDDVDDGNEMSDYITCNIEMVDSDKGEDDVMSDDSNEDEQVEEPTEVVNFDTLVDDIMAEDDSELDDEDDDEDESEEMIDIDISTVTPQTVMTYFVYNSGVLVTDKDDGNYAEFSVQKVENGYEFYDGKNNAVLPTKIEAIDTLLKTLNGQI